MAQFYPTAAAATTAETDAATEWGGVSTSGFTVYREGVYLYLRDADIKPLPWPATDGSESRVRCGTLASAEDLDIEDPAEASAIDNGHLQ